MSSTPPSAARPTSSRCVSANPSEIMTNDDDEYVYDDASGEWLPASEARARAEAAAAAPEVRDAVGNLLSDGDSVVLVKDLAAKGAGQTLKVGNVIKSIRPTGDPTENDSRHDGLRGVGLRTEERRVGKEG